MKNTFAVTMTLLLALALGGSFAGYRLATTPHEETTKENPQVLPESTPSADAAATGAAGAPGALGDVKPKQAGGTASGPNGAVARSGGEMSGNGAATANPQQSAAGTPTDPDTRSNEQAATGNPPAATANAAEKQGDPSAGGKLFAGNCAGCHGANAQGGVGPSLVMANGPKAWTLAQFTTVLREGKLPEGRELNNIMPRFSDAQLTDADVTNIFAYVKGLH